MTDDENLVAASYDWWSHDGSVSPMPPKIVIMKQNEPAMTIHPDGKITLGENAEPTEAAAACINAMSDMIQSIIKQARMEERAAIVAWLRGREQEMTNEMEQEVSEIRFAVLHNIRQATKTIATSFEAGEHLK